MTNRERTMSRIELERMQKRLDAAKAKAGKAKCEYNHLMKRYNELVRSEAHG